MPFANERPLSANSQAMQTVPDLPFDESCMFFNGDTSDLDGCFSTQDNIPPDFAEIYRASQQQQGIMSAMHPGSSTSMWSPMLPSPWLPSPESIVTQSAAPFTQLGSDERMNTVMTIESLSPAAREAVIELVLKDGGSLRIATRTTKEY
jgi:hypothetical protein